MDSIYHYVKAEVGLEDADFWLTSGSQYENTGEPVETFNEKFLGVKVIRTDVLLPKFAYYQMQHVFMSGHWKQLHTKVLTPEHLKSVVFTQE